MVINSLRVECVIFRNTTVRPSKIREIKDDVEYREKKKATSESKLRIKYKGIDKMKPIKGFSLLIEMYAIVSRMLSSTCNNQGT